MRFCVLMNDNSYPGREYIRELANKGFSFDAIVIGSFPTVSEREEERCSGFWTPPLIESTLDKNKIFRFRSLGDLELLNFLMNNRYDYAIQGGTGILKEAVISLFRLGIFNFHPGRLPQYRGCSAPEWQLLENQPIVCTCHLIDAGIDTGPIYKEKILKVNTASYGLFRASIYPEISKFVAEFCDDVGHFQSLSDLLKVQEEKLARYRKPMESGLLTILKKDYFKKEIQNDL